MEQPDPDCAICRAPASAACECESKGLDLAIKQAEQRMMQSVYHHIRQWVRAHAQDYILEYYRLLADRRKTAHDAYIDRMTAQSYHFYHRPPHPSDLAAAHATLKRGIDEDWRASVQRYPEVLEYYFGLVEMTLPEDDEPGVKDPPLSALSGARKPPRRSGGGGEGCGPAAGRDGREAPLPRRRTPPTMPPLESRPDRRMSAPPRDGRGPPFRGQPPPPPPPTSYYGGAWGR